ncbi:hypothetical protein BACCAP_04051 [Pseudoflavonifractor capillosus ATCC 29799]|uniref:Uncharacterized protein n=1 Tax=Pseudoflavonifractor capillosus ATCC 29799 TaxID=411467 RepID=A6P0P0_9FIRM|nr:hypothetical protein BACCAP_04051 [Pseudoflavonifractor capillosus ATCC 29799]
MGRTERKSGAKQVESAVFILSVKKWIVNPWEGRGRQNKNKLKNLT